MGAYVISLDHPAATDADRVGPKAANLAALARGGLPTPGGFCFTAEAYRRQIAYLGLTDRVRDYQAADLAAQRRLSVEVRLQLYQGDFAPDLKEQINGVWEAERKPAAVRSSALIEDRMDAGFAGQFESFLGLSDKDEFLVALRACWAALWTTNARRAMTQRGHYPSETAMAVLVQPLVAAIASGGGLSVTAEGNMLLSATWGLGSTIAQGEVVPDRIALSRQAFVRTIESGRKHHRDACLHGAGATPERVPEALVNTPCLSAGQATELGRLMRKAETILQTPVEIEWALDDSGFKLLQARPFASRPRMCQTRSGSSILASTDIPPASAGVLGVPSWSTASAKSAVSHRAIFW